MNTDTEFRVFGPPGCGKTTWTADQVRRAVEKYGPESVLITSLTRTAALKVKQHDLPVPMERVGTLHSHAYRALNRPTIVEDPKVLKDWNAEYPALAVTQGDDMEDAAIEGRSGGAAGDQMLSDVNRYRAMMLPEEAWKSDARAFYAKWCDWKQQIGGMDFTDLIANAVTDAAYAPGSPQVIFVDEGQDHDRLELSLVRRWSQPVRGVERLVIVGDPDQNLYLWRGSEPEAFLEPELPPENYRVLKQSYRVPKAVHAAAVEWIERSPARRPVEYLATKEDGAVEHLPHSFGTPVALLEHVKKHTAEGKSVMFLTACGYQLDPLKLALKEAGIPFHNPFRTRRGDWNPLRAGAGKNRTSQIERLLSYTEPYDNDGMGWTNAQAMKWLGSLKGVLQRNAIKGLDNEPPEDDFDPDLWLREGADPGKVFNILAGDVSWFESHLKAEATRRLEYALRVWKLRGGAALRERPQIVIGTIHSVKGEEADVVYLCPDLSRAGFIEWRSGNPQLEASIYRQFYVGMTRAKERLVLTAPATPMSVW